ncbi:hypothetical protein SACC_11770 [Saccharolobus caldissimus]|uniref:Uncharacterized protein n=2 Tax=Saccharolobus TaxID=2100760 RepID=A0AAQ4CQS9_9CREN|nr:hypothetical protein SACC_11770 [Saccharolobus caldissimus]
MGSHIYASPHSITIFQNSMRVIGISFLMPSRKYIDMRIVEDKDGERFLVIESDEDFEKFKEDLLKIAREKAKDRARKPSYETQSPK